MEKEKVRVELEKAGIKDISPEILNGFYDFLRDMDDPTVNTKIAKQKKIKSKKATKTKEKIKSEDFVPSENASYQFDEDSIWIQRLKDWDEKVKNLDMQLRECSQKQANKRTKLSFYEEQLRENDPLRAYPVLEPTAIGRGFIRPPDIVNPASLRFPIYRKEMCYPAPDFIKQQRIAERKKKPYVPGNENRQDALRWRIRERIVYSHPDFYLRRG